jgi:BASS family bile acid:Na+ symporter
MNFINFLYTQALPVMLFLIMMGLGLTLTLIDFKRVVVLPKAVSIGLIAQMLLMPLLAFSLAYLIGPPPEIALGLIILAACPSGVTANAYSFAARADLALCVTLAAITSLLIVVTLPFFTYLGFLAFYAEAEVFEIPTLAIIYKLVQLTIIPIILGMSFRWLWPTYAARVVEPLRRVTVSVLIFVLVAAALSSYKEVIDNFATAGLLVIVMNVTSMAMGFGLAKFFKIPIEQVVTITFEVGVQNLALALLITLTVLGRPELAVTSLIYAVVMPMTALAFVSIGKKLINKNNVNSNI